MLISAPCSQAVLQPLRRADPSSRECWFKAEGHYGDGSIHQRGVWTQFKENMQRWSRGAKHGREAKRGGKQTECDRKSSDDASVDDFFREFQLLRCIRCCSPGLSAVYARTASINSALALQLISHGMGTLLHWRVCLCRPRGCLHSQQDYFHLFSN